MGRPGWERSMRLAGGRALSSHTRRLVGAELVNRPIAGLSDLIGLSERLVAPGAEQDLWLGWLRWLLFELFEEPTFELLVPVDTLGALSSMVCDELVEAFVQVDVRLLLADPGPD